MADFKKMDDYDFAFVNKPLTKKEDKEFSDFLKSRRSVKEPFSRNCGDVKEADIIELTEDPDV